jgi:hypothetical protein
VAIDGLLYLLKNIEIISEKIKTYDENIVRKIKIILDADKARIFEEYQK